MNKIISLENGLIFNYEMGHFGRIRRLVPEGSCLLDSCGVRTGTLVYLIIWS